MFSKSATVHSNDPQQPKVRIGISCIVKQYISVKPSNRVSLVGFEGEKINKEATITSLEDQLFKITEITSDIDDKIKYKLKTKKKGREYTIEIKNRSTEEGSFQGKIVLKTNSKKKPHIVLPVHVSLRGKVAIRPSTLSFGTIDTTKENFDTMRFKKRIVLKDVRGDGLTIKKIKSSSDWIMAENETKKGGKQYSIVITLDKDKLPKGQFSEKVNIRTSYRRKPLVVDIKGEVI